VLIAIPLGLMLAAQPSDDCAAGMRLGRAGDLAGAEPRLAACIKLTTSTIEAFLLLAGIYQGSDRTAKLEQVALKGIRRFPTEKRFYLTAGTLAGRDRRFDEAIRILGNAHRRWPGDPRIQPVLASSHFGSGTAALDRGDNERAAADLLRAAELAPADAEALINLGRAQHNLLHYEAALATFNRVAELQPSAPLVRFHRALAHYSLGHLDAAIADLNAQIEADPSYWPAYMIRGLAHLGNGDDTAAVADLERAADKMPDNALAQFSFARALVRMDKLPDAESKLKAALRLDAEDPGPANLLVTVLNRLGRPDEARALAKTAAGLAQRRRWAAPGEIRFEDVGGTARR